MGRETHSPGTDINEINKSFGLHANDIVGIQIYTLQLFQNTINLSKDYI